MCEGDNSCLSDVVHCDAIGVGYGKIVVGTYGRVVGVSVKPTWELVLKMKMGYVNLELVSENKRLTVFGSVAA